MSLHKFLYCLISVLFIACGSNDINSGKVFQTLNDKQAKAIIKIDGKDFYPNESVFKGNIQVYDNSFRLNLNDQFDSNVIFTIAGDKWYETKRTKRKITIENQTSGSLMVGKMKDRVKHTGEGFLMTQGELEIEAFTDEKFIVKFKGKISKYEFLQDSSKWNDFEGVIVMKKPEVILQNITKDKVYF